MKYLVYLGSGGLTHMLTGIAFCIKKAEELNRSLIIRVDNHSYFNKKFFDYFHIDSSLNVIEDLGDFSKEEKKLLNLRPTSSNKGNYFINNKNASLIPNNSDKKFLFFTRFCGINQEMKYIKCKKYIVNKIKKLSSYNNILGVHFRNTDIKSNFDKILKKINNLIEEKQITTIYLATDDYLSINKFKEKLNKPIITFTVPPSSTKGLHMTNFNKDTLILNTLTDMYNLINCEYFIPTLKSSLSTWIVELRKNNTLFNNE